MASILPHSISSAVPYQRHQPEKTLLHKLIQKNLLHFYHQVEREQEKELPYFVKKEFEEFLKCGLLSYGFLRLQCQSCKQERLLAFSCKRRGFCPSCGAKRMAEMASHLVDQVLPYKPLRQWGLRFPFPLRLLFAKDPQLIGLVLNLVLRTIYISRPSLSEARLSLNNKGQGVYKLKTPYRNGTTPIVLDPLDFLSRLASLIPRPKIHFIRSHGVFAPNCKYRSLIVP